MENAGLILAIVAMVVMAGIIGFALIFHIHKTARPVAPPGYNPPPAPPKPPQPPEYQPNPNDPAGL